MGRITNARDSIAAELHAWQTTGLRIAIWGGLGEAAAFLQRYAMDPAHFPIADRRWLKENPTDIILLPCPEQAVEIVRQIDAAHIPYEGILVPRDGRLVDFHAAEMVFA